MHFNTRYICTTQQWFGGGMDVTPSKTDNAEKKEFHSTLKNLCNRHSKGYYKKGSKKEKVVDTNILKALE